MRHIEKAIERYYTAKPTLSPKEDLEHYEEIR
jgi:SpoVK/Ycf46/Vps4 family AAA+-type ATPase